MTQHRKISLILFVFLMFVLLPQVTNALNLGTLQKSNTINLSSGETCFCINLPYSDKCILKNNGYNKKKESEVE